MSDNATTYLAAAEELKKLFESPESKEILHRQNVGWQFIPKRAPWFGGFWERLIGLTKASLKKSSRKSVGELGNVTDPRGRDRSHFK